jgi:hypothetical protein
MEDNFSNASLAYSDLVRAMNRFSADITLHTGRAWNNFDENEATLWNLTFRNCVHAWKTTYPEGHLLVSHGWGEPHTFALEGDTLAEAIRTKPPHISVASDRTKIIAHEVAMQNWCVAFPMGVMLYQEHARREMEKTKQW